MQLPYKTPIAVILFFACLAFLYQTPDEATFDIEKYTNQYDMPAVALSLKTGYCEKYPSKYCEEYFNLASTNYFSNPNANLKSLFNLGLKESTRYIDNLTSGATIATSEDELTFIKQYNQWLIQVSNIFVVKNYLSPLNLNLHSLVKSFVITNSWQQYIIQLFVLMICILYLLRFFPLPLIAASTVLTLIFSVLLSCLYLAKPSNYIIASNALGLTGLSLILGACLKHRISKIHSKFLIHPFTSMPLAILVLIIILYMLILNTWEMTTAQLSPQFSSCILGFLIGNLMRIIYPLETPNDLKAMMQPQKFDQVAWEKHFSKHLDEIKYYQKTSDALFELNLQGIMTDHIRNLAQKILPTYFKLIELEQNNEQYLKESSKFSTQFELKNLISKNDDIWLHKIQTSHLMDPNNEIAHNIKAELVSRNFEFKPKVKIKASRLRRLLAFLLDLGFISVALSLTKSQLHSFFTMIFGLDFDPSYTELISKFLVWGFMIIPPLLIWRATFGKKILSIKIASAQANVTIQWWQLIGRELIGKPISSFLFFFGYLIILFPGKKTLHDLLFSTSVIIDYKE